jgi:hypothetical protein
LLSQWIKLLESIRYTKNWFCPAAVTLHAQRRSIFFSGKNIKEREKGLHVFRGDSRRVKSHAGRHSRSATKPSTKKKKKYFAEIQMLKELSRFN